MSPCSITALIQNEECRRVAKPPLMKREVGSHSCFYETGILYRHITPTYSRGKSLGSACSEKQPCVQWQKIFTPGAQRFTVAESGERKMLLPNKQEQAVLGDTCHTERHKAWKRRSKRRSCLYIQMMMRAVERWLTGEGHACPCPPERIYQQNVLPPPPLSLSFSTQPSCPTKKGFVARHAVSSLVCV